jgi:hypothetical protein
MAPYQHGHPAVAVRVQPDWKPKKSIADLPTVDPSFQQYISRHWEDVKARYGEPNNPKIWLQSLKSPSSERPIADLQVGRTDFWTVKCLEAALQEGDLRRQYESGAYSVVNDLPGLVAAVCVVLTSDNHLVLAQRQGREVAFAGGAWCATFEEQWNPLEEALPHETVLRGLHEEFNLDPAHRVWVSVDNIALYAIGREWGAFWNTVLIYVVRLPASAKSVLDRWSSLSPPQDNNEHIAVAAVPLDDKGIPFLKGLVRMPRNERLSVDQLREVCGADCIVGLPSDGVLHPTHARARIILALWAEGHLQ